MRRRIAVAVALGLLLTPRWILAGDPLGDFPIDADSLLSQFSPAAVFDGGGNLLVLWWGFPHDRGSLLSRRFSADYEPLGEPLISGDDAYPQSVAADRTGFTLISSDSAGESITSSRLDRNGAEAGESFPLGNLYFPRVASDGGRGSTVAVGTGPAGVLAVPLNAGRPAGKPIQVSADPKADAPDVAMAADGRFVVIWTKGRAIFGQRYTASGSPLGSPFWVGSFDRSGNFPTDPRIAGAADGRFVVAWPYGEKLFLRLYGPNGEPLTGPLVVTEDPYTYFQLISVTMNAAGEILVGWDTFTDDATPEIRGRFYGPSGRPAGRAFSLVVLPSLYYSFDTLTLAAGPAGRFAMVWQASSLAPTYQNNIFGRGLQWAPPGDAPCVFEAGAFSCDLRRDGGAAEVSYAFGGRPGDVPLLGDLDGDGRDEPCVYRGPRFLCDPARDGGSAGASVLFGSGVAAGDVPLLGDLDGDGRDDPCLRRGDRFLCDTAHNGGAAEVVVALGRAGDPALLGDVDGDGDDDPCVVESGRLLCDVRHGGRAGTVLPFDVDPAAGDVPLLGDLDGDGRDDPCVYRAGRFLCDTGHTGSLATALSFGGGPGATPLFGDLQHL